MTDTAPPDAPAATTLVASSTGNAGVDGFLILQAVIVVALGAMAIAFICQGDTHDAALVGTGLIGALSINRKGPGQ